MADEWTDLDEDIWEGNDNYIWFPIIETEGGISFVCSGVVYEFESIDKNYDFSSQNIIYSFLANNT